jgi:ferritin-like metal-binding protein YciE
MKDASKLLDQTLQEEIKTDQLLTSSRRPRSIERPPKHRTPAEQAQ